MSIGALILNKPASDEHSTFYLAKRETLLGRDKQADIILNNKSSSRKHAVIKKTKIGYLLIDCDSHNGTQVNGITIVRKYLRDGDRLYFGDIQFEFHEIDEGEIDVSAARSVEKDARPTDAESSPAGGKTITPSLYPGQNSLDQGAVQAWQIISLFESCETLGLDQILQIVICNLAGLQGMGRVRLYLPACPSMPKSLWIKSGAVPDRPGVLFSEEHILETAHSGKSRGVSGGHIVENIQKKDLDAVYLALRIGGQSSGCLYLEGKDRLSSRLIQVGQAAARAIGLGMTIWQSGIQANLVNNAAVAQKAAIIGKSHILQEQVRRALKAAQSDATVLIRGETGTGKELFARLIGEESGRKTYPFLTVQSSALEENLLGSLLFGHEKGAYTGAVGMKRGMFEEADCGTLFLDEIGDLSPGMQIKLLRVLQTGEFMRLGGTKLLHVNVRLITATNRNLEAAVKAGQFREDLYFRLKVIDLNLPPLRERREDIPELIRYFIEALSPAVKKFNVDISKEAMAALELYDWPGNIRELRNVIESCLVLSDKACITWHDLPLEIIAAAAPAAGKIETPGESAAAELHAVQRRHAAKILQACRGNKKAAADRLGISRSTLYRLFASGAPRDTEQPAPPM